MIAIRLPWRLWPRPSATRHEIPACSTKSKLRYGYYYRPGGLSSVFEAATSGFALCFLLFRRLKLPHLRHRTLRKIHALLALLTTLRFAGVVILCHGPSSERQFGMPP